MEAFNEFQGHKITNIPNTSGVYSWYYKPLTITRVSLSNTLGQFLKSESRITTSIIQRYGVRVRAEGSGTTVLGSEEQSIPEALEQAFANGEEFLTWFFRSPHSVHFSRPIYIGIAKNLYDRVHNQHYVTLLDYWDQDHKVSKFISARPGAVVQEVMDELEVPHSFAIEARVKGIRPRDLMVAILETECMPLDIGPDLESSVNESGTRRSLERILQLLSDPICGRR